MSLQGVTFEVVERVNDDIVRLRVHDRFHEIARGTKSHVAAWTTCRTRKPATCVVSGQEIPRGAEAFRPIGNMSYRSWRIAAGVINP